MKGDPPTVGSKAERSSQERQKAVKTQTQKTVSLGELILTVFDKAAQYSLDPREVSRLATQTVAQMLWRGRKLTTPRPS
jgi:hypothetical protein